MFDAAFAAGTPRRRLAAHECSPRNFQMSLRLLLTLMLMFAAPVALAAKLPPVEPMPTLDAATLASPALLNGDGYTVDPRVPVVGYMGQFTLRAAGGTFAADGTEMLAIRIAELS